MQEVELDGRQYRTGKLDAFKQFHLMRKLMPLFSGLGDTYSHQAMTEQSPPNGESSFWKSLAPIAQAVSEMSTEDSEWILKTCLTAVSVNNGRSYVPVTTPQGHLMFDDMEMTTMVQLAFTVIQDNLGSFFPGPQANGLDNEEPFGSVAFAAMNDEEDWIMRPVLEGLCKYESLIDGTLGLFDVARMNEALDVQNENEARAQEAAEDNRRG